MPKAGDSEFHANGHRVQGMGGKWRQILRVCLSCMLCWAPSIFAETFSPQSSTDLFAIGSLYHADRTDSLPTSQSLEEFEKKLQPAARINLHGGSYWLHVSIRSESPQSQWVLGHFGSYIETIDVYLIGDGQVQHVTTGQFYPYDFPFTDGAALTVKRGVNYEAWVLFDSRYYTGKPTAYLIDRYRFIDSLLTDNLLIIGCLGAILVLALYNLLLSLWTASRDYLFYSLYLILTFIGWAAVFKVFSQTLHVTHSALIILPFFLNIVANTFFYRHFLALDKHHPVMVRYAQAIALVAFILALISPWVPLWLNYSLINAVSTLWLAGGCVAGWVCWHAGYKPARFYNAGFICMAISGGLVVLPNFGLPRVTQKEYLITLVAQTLDVTLLALALADRINLMRQDKEQALHYARAVDQKATQSLLEANKKLHLALQVAEENQQKKDQFIMAISHELRTPLHAISGALEQVVEHNAPPAREELFQYMQFGIDRLSTQVENLIMLAETHHINMRPHLRPFIVGSLIKRIQHLAKACLVDKPVIFEVVAHGERISRYNGDDYLLIRLIMPVVENACKYTQEGRVTLLITLLPDGIKFCVSDTGPGIPLLVKEKLFESFTQGSMGYQRTHEGLGIGLTVSHRIAQVLGSTMEIDSATSQGTRVSFWVPMQQETEPLPTQPINLEGHVLIVEDNFVNARVLYGMLKMLGFSAEIASNGVVAVASVREQTFDAILMDLQMPLMDGFTATEQMRAQGVRCPIVAITANGDHEARIKSINVGMNDVLTKPVTKDALREKLEYWMSVAV